MKIIKIGTVNTERPITRLFKCDVCNCVFEAEPDEYYKAYIPDISQYWCKCPICGVRSDELDC